jgi:DNA-binding NarL/FixJ family response regulator
MLIALSNAMIKIILADHQRIFRIGTAAALAAEEDIRIVGQPHCLQQLIDGLERGHARVLVLSDAFLGDFDTILKIARDKQTAILLLVDKSNIVAPGIVTEVQGLLPRSASAATVVQCVRQVARGGRVINVARDSPTGLPQSPVGARVRQRLSHLELRIIGFVVQGYRNREIALLMDATEDGIKYAIRGIFDKTGVFDRLQLTLFALHHHILIPDRPDVTPASAIDPIAATQPHRNFDRWRPVN